MCVHTYKGWGQRTTYWSQFPPPRGFQRSNSICQAWWQLLSPTQPISPTQTKCLIMKNHYCILVNLNSKGQEVTDDRTCIDFLPYHSIFLSAPLLSSGKGDFCLFQDYFALNFTFGVTEKKKSTAF